MARPLVSLNAGGPNGVEYIEFVLKVIPLLNELVICFSADTGRKPASKLLSGQV